MENKNGIYIFFNKKTGELLHVGAAGNKGGVTGFYASPNTGIVPQVINGTTPTVVNYFQQNVKTLNPNQSFENYINDYSILFICLKPSTTQTDFAQSLNVLLRVLKNTLKTTI